MNQAPSAIGAVCVFCGSASGRDPRHASDAAALGRALAEAGVTMVYGGGGVGLMGAAARAALSAGGRVIGVIPRFLQTPELALAEAELVTVASMHERKAEMFARADGFAVLPGGVGTLEEAVELLSWARLNLHRKPIVFLDVAGYWTPLFELIAHSVEEGFTPAAFRGLWRSVGRPQQVLPALQEMAVESARVGEAPLNLI